MSLSLQKALVLFSGGQDSTTCLYWALNKYKEVHAINILYGQRHIIESQQAQFIAQKESIPLLAIDITNIFSIGVDNALTHRIEVSNNNLKEIPNTFVPGRNLLFINIAMIYASKIGASSIIGGMCETDFSGYPDCRNEFIKSLNHTINLATDQEFIIETPLMYLDKAQTWLMAKELGKLTEIIEYTHTCYLGDRNKLHSWGYGCGNCPACILRKKGYFKAFPK